MIRVILVDFGDIDKKHAMKLECDWLIPVDYGDINLKQDMNLQRLTSMKIWFRV